MTKKEVLEMLNEMLQETYRCNGFIAGFIMKSWAISLIERKIKEVEDKED